jgi:hypothetical protein
MKPSSAPAPSANAPAATARVTGRLLGLELLALLIHAGLGWCGVPDVGKCS